MHIYIYIYYALHTYIYLYICICNRTCGLSIARIVLREHPQENDDLHPNLGVKTSGKKTVLHISWSFRYPITSWPVWNSELIYTNIPSGSLW